MQADKCTRAIGELVKESYLKIRSDVEKRFKELEACNEEYHLSNFEDILKDELLANWELTMNEQPLYKVEPLR